MERQNKNMLSLVLCDPAKLPLVWEWEGGSGRVWVASTPTPHASVFILWATKCIDSLHQAFAACSMKSTEKNQNQTKMYFSKARYFTLVN